MDALVVFFCLTNFRQPCHEHGNAKRQARELRISGGRTKGVPWQGKGCVLAETFGMKNSCYQNDNFIPPKTVKNPTWLCFSVKIPRVLTKTNPRGFVLSTLDLTGKLVEYGRIISAFLQGAIEI